MTKRNHGNRIKPPSVPAGGAIPLASPPTGAVLFSFRYLDFSKEHFRVDNCKSGYLDQLLEKLIQISRMQTKQFQSDRRLCDTLHSHSFDFALSQEPHGYEHIRPREIWDGKQWQFALTVNEHGRIFGFFYGDVFYVVWLDPTHHVDPKRQ